MALHRTLLSMLIDRRTAVVCHRLIAPYRRALTINIRHRTYFMINELCSHCRNSIVEISVRRLAIIIQIHMLVSTISLEQFAGDSTFVAVTASFPQKTEDWTFCPVLQLFCPMNVSSYWLLCDPTLLLRVLAVLGLYATSSLFVIIIIISRWWHQGVAFQ